MGGVRRTKEAGIARIHFARGEHVVAHLALTGERPPVDLAPDARTDLMATIESTIIPRLLLAHAPAPPVVAVSCDSRPPPTEQEIFELARIAACHDLNGALAFVEDICCQGLSLEIVLLDLVAGSARLLGEQWQEDLRSFTEVSAGLGTLQQVVHVLSPSFAPSLPHRGLVVLTAVAGEQHTLGLHLVGEFLRRAGWGVEIDPTLTEAELVELVASERVEMLGFTVSNDELLQPLSELIASVRRSSHNPDLTIMLGGPLDLRAFAALNGVTLSVSDPREAVHWLENHVKRQG